MEIMQNIPFEKAKLLLELFFKPKIKTRSGLIIHGLKFKTS